MIPPASCQKSEIMNIVAYRQKRDVRPPIFAARIDGLAILAQNSEPISAVLGGVHELERCNAGNHHAL